jgi:hypothetical protein
MCVGVRSVSERAAGDWNADVDARLQYALKMASGDHILHPNQCVILVTGYQPGAGSTNTLRVVRYQPDAPEASNVSRPAKTLPAAVTLSAPAVTLTAPTTADPAQPQQ